MKSGTSAHLYLKIYYQLTTGVFPKDWNCAKVASNDKNNYRAMAYGARNFTCNEYALLKTQSWEILLKCLISFFGRDHILVTCVHQRLLSAAIQLINGMYGMITEPAVRQAVCISPFSLSYSAFRQGILTSYALTLASGWFCRYSYLKIIP